MRNHAIEVRHAANGFTTISVYAYCTCRWESSRYALTGTELDGADIAVLAAEYAGGQHVEQASSSGF